MKDKNFFEELNAINVNEYTEKKDGLTYLTWSWAWTEIKKRYPNANYVIKKFENNLPYVLDERIGLMVFTEVTIENITHEMWLPVMNSNNKAMKHVSYEYTTKSGKKAVEAATMFDVNKTIMRCLVKNLAMFGLGLYIYAGEDLPEDTQNEIEELKTKIKTFPNALEVIAKFGKKLSQCTEEELRAIVSQLEKGEKNE